MSVTRFSHVTINCTDLDASLAFYRDVLEMSISDRPLPEGFPRAAIGTFVDGAWCLHFFQASAAQQTEFATLPERRTGG
jgi:catechol 2,3-dioxygenase-like lactoylglutathione lyase family enzyme